MDLMGGGGWGGGGWLPLECKGKKILYLAVLAIFNDHLKKSFTNSNCGIKLFYSYNKRAIPLVNAYFC
jgi:hypothetical protein